MQALTEKGQMKVAEIADRHGVSSAAAAQLLSAIAAGGGRQAQFNHPDLGGMGQWSQGGMIMIGDMFNQGLKARVAALCSDLAQTWQEAELLPSEAPQSASSSEASSASLFTPAAFGRRWPAELGEASSTGSQNDMHYAVFPASRRLAIERNGQMTIYDTQDHRIGGVAQAQGGDQSVRFTSQSGIVRLDDLPIIGPAPAAAGDAAPVVAADAREPGTTRLNSDPGEGVQPAPAQAPGAPGDDEIFSRLERLADLHSRAIITAEEFAAKKAELLARL